MLFNNRHNIKQLKTRFLYKITTIQLKEVKFLRVNLQYLRQLIVIIFQINKLNNLAELNFLKNRNKQI